MAQIVYASFPNATQCEQAAGALLDFGVRKEDLSIVASDTFQSSTVGATILSRDQNQAARESSIGGEPGNTAVLIRETGSFGDVGVTSADAGQRYVDPGIRTVDAVVIGDSARDAVTESSDLPTPNSISSAAKDGISVTTPADAAAGAAEGAGWGLGIGILAGLAALSIPGIGIVVGGGALATAIGAAIGTTAAGAVAGGVMGYLKDQGVPDPVAENYEADIRQGGAVLAVSTPSNNVDSVTAEAIMNKYGALRVNAY